MPTGNSNSVPSQVLNTPICAPEKEHQTRGAQLVTHQGEFENSSAASDCLPKVSDVVNKGVHDVTPVSVPLVHSQTKRRPGRPPKQQKSVSFQPIMPSLPPIVSPSPASSLSPMVSSPAAEPTLMTPLLAELPQTQLENTSSSSSQSLASTRPKRVRCQAKNYDASTGKWI